MRLAGEEIVKEVYAFYSPTYAGPEGNISNNFYVSDSEDAPVIDGVTIPVDAYTTRKEIEVDLSMTNLQQFQGILGKR